ncbi:MAG: thioredoxin domain-containing protein [Desulfobacteraceae bacterium]|nr:thioredoxin domain-containing protein [Desulfobacteraceae bacterium]
MCRREGLRRSLSPERRCLKEPEKETSRHRFRLLLCLLFILAALSSGGHVCTADAKTRGASNLLIDEKSPYLLQHAGNPVNWYPWGEEAFQKARQEDKPIFLSIGYATCHWCHVMAHESFEDEEVARILNKYYIAIKVDREERPDIDKIYMSVCQALTGRGGWPLTILMTPEGKPFFAGTYFPKSGRMGMSGLIDILNQIAAMWEKDRARILKAGREITNAIQPGSDPDKPVHVVSVDTLKKGYSQLAARFDPRWGGFGAAPKFPTPHQLTFLLRWHRRSADPNALKMVEKSLDEMRHGGIYDQIGSGFHRYSVDEQWLVPHFEKMLYDQAMLAMAYIEAYQATGKARFGKVAREIFAYVLRDMTAPEGGFYCAEDADSEGKEGLFYVWTPEEIKGHLGDVSGDLFCRFYDITEKGNFEEGKSIPHMPLTIQAFAQREGMDPAKLDTVLKDARERLFDTRKKRGHPLKDDKILTSWNGLMIAALAKGYQALGDEPFVDAARKAADFILKNLRTSDGRLLRRYRNGEAAYPGYLDDYAFMVWGLIELYEATFEVTYLEAAIALNREMIDIFWDKKGGGLYFTGKGNEALIAKSKEIYDGALPSGNSVAALNFLRLGRMTGRVDLEEKAEQLTATFSREVTTQPIGYTQLLSALEFMLGPAQEIVIAGDLSLDSTRDMVRVVRSRFLPNKVVLMHQNGPDGKRLEALSPFAREMRPMNQKSTAYVCEQYACKVPVTDAGKLEKLLN